eukprot:7435659-Lingulodinium_polyedra.AAC.1
MSVAERVNPDSQGERPLPTRNEVSQREPERNDIGGAVVTCVCHAEDECWVRDLSLGSHNT